MTASGTAKPNSLEIFREKWQRQLLADKTVLISDLKVAIAIGWHMNRNRGGEAWPGIRTLATLTALSKPTVIGATRRLESNGHVSIVRSRSGNRRNANRYKPVLKASAQTTGRSPFYHVVKPRLDHLGKPQGLTRTLYLTSEGTSYSDKISAPSGDGAINKDSAREERKEGDTRERKVEECESCIESPPSLERELYGLARKYYGERGASCVAKFLADGHGVREGLDDVRDAIESGEDIGYVLWRP